MRVFKYGYSLRQVAEVTGFSRSSIKNAVIRFQLTSGYNRRSGSGLRRAISAVMDVSYIVSMSLRRGFATSI